MYGRTPNCPQRPRWPDLPPDLLREISGRLRHVTNFVHFHAVCKAWRSSYDPATLTRRKQRFLPWLLAPSTNTDDPLKLRCVFSKKSFLAPRQSSNTSTNWVCGDHDASLRYFTSLPCPTLHDPLVAHSVPTVLSDSFPCKKGLLVYHPNGTVYGDGTILLYDDYYIDEEDDTIEFKAAIFHPGDATWMVVETTLESPNVGDLYVAYHHGKILVTEEHSTMWHVLTPGAAGNSDDTHDMLVPKQEEHHKYLQGYVLESQGELLWVSVNVHRDYPNKRSLVDTLSVSVYVLQVTPPPKKMRWVRKHWWTLDDRVMFLGRPNSFSLAASRLDNDRGCAYFVHRHCVIRYNLFRHKAEIFDWLPQTLKNNQSEMFELLSQPWKGKNCTWLVLQPTMAPTEEIRERLLKARKWKRLQQVVAPVTARSIIEHVVMPFQPCFRILVCNLPLTVNSSRLQYFFSRHGEVSSAEIICYKKTRTSKGRGFVTMATTHVCQADALAALSGLVWDGNDLEVSLVDKLANQRRRPSQQHVARSTWL